MSMAAWLYKGEFSDWTRRSNASYKGEVIKTSATLKLTDTLLQHDGNVPIVQNLDQRHLYSGWSAYHWHCLELPPPGDNKKADWLLVGFIIAFKFSADFLMACTRKTFVPLPSRWHPATVVVLLVVGVVVGGSCHREKDFSWAHPEFQGLHPEKGALLWLWQLFHVVSITLSFLGA